MNKGTSNSHRKTKNSPMKSSNEPNENKHNLLSLHTKRSQDLYSNIYKLPLKQLLQHKREDQASYSQKKQRSYRAPVEIYGNTDFKTKHRADRSSRKTSIYCHQESTRHLMTDRSSKNFVPNKIFQLKRTKTQLQNLNEEDYIKTVQPGKVINKGSSSCRKEYVSIKLQQMMALLATYSKLKSKNGQLCNEIEFYYKQLDSMKDSDNSVLKALTE